MFVSPGLLAIVAGLANGTYLSPIKKNDPNVHLIWIFFSLITYFLIPIVLVITAYQNNNYNIPLSATITMLATGLIYGFGLFLLTESIKLIGIGIPLALNISLGILTGSFFSILISGNLHSIFNYRYIFAYITIFIAVTLYAIALSKREKNNNILGRRGLYLSIIGSIFCSSQGACLSYFSDFLKSNNHGYLAQLIPWSLIFIGCSVVFIFSHYLQNRKNKSKILLSKKSSVLLAVVIMSFLQLFSVLIYTYANVETAKYSQIYLWGIFMGCIVIASTIVSYCKREWKAAKHSANILNILAVFFLILSVIEMCRLSS